MKNVLLTVTCLLLVAFVLNGCGQKKVEEGEKEVYKIGAVRCLAAFLRVLYVAIAVALEELNIKADLFHLLCDERL
ncbi:unnamed protein product, partial [marine sediment metagenome]